MNFEKISKQLIKHEGIRLKPYRCSANKLTIGVGRNLQDVGITRGEAMFLLRNDITKAILQARLLFDRFDFFPEQKQLVIVDMIFNLGIESFKTFKKMNRAIKKENWEKAAEEMKNSKWYNQVGNRAETLYNMMHDKTKTLYNMMHDTTNGLDSYCKD